MPSLSIDNLTSFAYLDSGEPQQESYTTLVIVHGLMFHRDVFSRTLPFAQDKGLRLICLNRRDYAPTTLYTPTDLRTLSEGGETEHAAFMEARGIEIAMFISRLIEELSLPLPSADGNAGGVGLLGWSLGNTASWGPIAAAGKLPKDILQRLQTYLRRLVIHSVPSLALGSAPPPNGYIPLFDDTIPDAERGPIFLEWLASYFTHGDVSTRDPAVLNSRVPVPGKKSTMAGMSPEDFNAISNFAPAERSDNYVMKMSNVLSKQADKALFDPKIRSFWPNLKVWCVYGDLEPWNMIFGAWEIERRAKSGGTDVQLLIFPGGNHFSSWDEPERTVDMYAKVCCS